MGTLQGRSRCRRRRLPPSMPFRQHQSALATSRPHLPTYAPGLVSPRPHLHRDWAPPPTSAPGLGSPRRHLHNGTGAHPIPDLIQGWARPLPHLRQDWAGSCAAATQVALEKSRDARAADCRRAGVRRVLGGAQGTQGYSGVLRVLRGSDCRRAGLRRSERWVVSSTQGTVGTRGYSGG